MNSNSENIVDFTLIFNRFKKKLYNYVLKITEDVMLTEDIIQNIFLKLYQNLDKIQSKEKISFWLFTTARNEIYTHYRKKKIQADRFNVEDTDDLQIISDDDLSDEYEKKEIAELMIKELNSIPAEQREVFILKEYSRLRYSEICGILGIDEKLVKSRLHKVRTKLVNRISKLIM